MDHFNFKSIVVHDDFFDLCRIERFADEGKTAFIYAATSLYKRHSAKAIQVNTSELRHATQEEVRQQKRLIF